MDVQATSATQLNSSIRMVLGQAVTDLEKAGVEEARLEAELLVSHVAQCPRLELPLRYDESLEQGAMEELTRLLAERRKHRPMQYVLGSCAFMGLELTIDERALIPRPETEGLVACVLRDKALWSWDRPRIVDVCTGSGCIALALAQERDQADIVALDHDERALELAIENARDLGFHERVELLPSDLLAVIPDVSVHAVVSNPPYVTTAECKVLPAQIKNFEPRFALDGGALGLDVISRLVSDALRALKSGGRLFMEIGASQGKAVCDMCRAVGFQHVSVEQDAANRDRVVMGTKP